jgi:hypothetical protein
VLEGFVSRVANELGGYGQQGVGGGYFGLAKGRIVMFIARVGFFDDFRQAFECALLCERDPRVFIFAN